MNWHILNYLRILWISMTIYKNMIYSALKILIYHHYKTRWNIYSKDTTGVMNSTISCVSHVLYLMWNCKTIREDIKAH